MYGVPFPHFHELMSIYGKDYATGIPAEGYVDAVTHMEKVAPTQVTLDSSDEDDVVGSGNVAQTIESAHAPSLKKIKTENLPKEVREEVMVLEVVLMSWLVYKHS